MHLCIKFLLSIHSKYECAQKKQNIYYSQIKKHQYMQNKMYFNFNIKN
jgi:hypothetical protein